MVGVLSQRVVACLPPRQAQARENYPVCVGDILIVEIGNSRAGQTHNVAGIGFAIATTATACSNPGLQACRATQRGCRRAVVHFVLAAQSADRQRFGVDRYRGVGNVKRWQCVVACQSATAIAGVAQGDGVDELTSRGHIFVVGRRPRVGQRLTFPPPDALLRLKDHNTDIVGAWYPKRVPTREGAPITLVNNKREALKADDQIHEVYTLPMGCTLFKADIFRKIAYPWFVTTPNLTQDSFFSELARQAGYKLICDTSIRCKHIDRITGEIYE